MQSKSIGLTILCWVEVIAAIRILLFTIPVFISQARSSHLVQVSSTDDAFMRMVTFWAVLYLLIGVSSLLGHRLWKMFQYGAAAAALISTAIFLNSVFRSGGSVEVIYLLPGIVSVILAAVVATQKT